MPWRFWMLKVLLVHDPNSVCNDYQGTHGGNVQVLSIDVLVSQLLYLRTYEMRLLLYMTEVCNTSYGIKGFCYICWNSSLISLSTLAPAFMTVLLNNTYQWMETGNSLCTIPNTQVNAYNSVYNKAWCRYVSNDINEKSWYPGKKTSHDLWWILSWQLRQHN